MDLTAMKAARSETLRKNFPRLRKAKSLLRTSVRERLAAPIVYAVCARTPGG